MIRNFLPIIACGFFFLLISVGFAPGVLSCDKWAKVKCVQGDVTVKREGRMVWDAVQNGELLCPGDMLQTGEDSRALIFFYNESTLRLKPLSTLSIPQDQEGKSFWVQLIEGAFHFFSRHPQSLTVFTPFISGQVEGTEFLAEASPDVCRILVLAGKVRASNEFGEILVSPGQAAEASKGQPPVLRLLATPRDAVQWTLYYPPLLDPTPETLAEPARSAALAWRDGNIKQALAILDSIPGTAHDDTLTIFHAQILLALGQVDRAEAVLQRAGSAGGAADDALKAVIAVVQNRKADALDLADRAVAGSPRSLAALMAQSYARQASFDLEGARESLRQAADIAPADALVLARLSELELAFGRVDKAMKAAEKAAGINPGLSRTQTVLGFAHLSAMDIDKARDAFEKAIRLDSADPLPRLGLGLAVIRKGDLAGGREQIEIAVALDPGNAIIRSYLGKAFYDEKRDGLAERQYAEAKELDPMDPTPWFYDAIRKQSINRPVEALLDLQKSIQLNDNRAVYRSSLLLDQDLAARSASLARIYSDLGFQQLALAEGWKSLAADPSNHSAHRFLADSYAALPRHEKARASALLQSQLLQPLNVNPIQPQLAESNLGILEGAGPSAPSFNEYNPLFTRNRVALAANATIGSQDTLGNDLALTALCDRLSVSLGQYYYQTDGYRENNDQQHQIYNAFVQAALGASTSLQAEYRYVSTRKGDLNLRFDDTNFADSLREPERFRSFRVSGRHAFRPGSDLLFNFRFADFWEGTDFLSSIGPYESPVQMDGASVEVQHLFRSRYFNLISGGQYIDSKSVQEDTFYDIASGLPLIGWTTTHHREVYGFYAYSLIPFPQNITWTVGAGLDSLKGESGDKINIEQFNPKFGLMWNLTPDTLFRAAVFRTLQKPTLSYQTIEPVQVAGFTQFSDIDSSGSDAWKYGAAVEHQFTPLIHAGIEATFRDMDVPIEDVIAQSIIDAPWEEYTGRAYFAWTPHPWIALSLEYGFERLERTLEAPGPEMADWIETHKLGLGLGFFHPSGFMARIKPTYVDQSGEFIVQPEGPPFALSTEPGDDQFVSVDAAIGYRLPNRYGFISLEARNLFDESFHFQDTDPANPRLAPEQVIVFKVSLSI